MFNLCFWCSITDVLRFHHRYCRFFVVVDDPLKTLTFSSQRQSALTKWRVAATRRRTVRSSKDVFQNISLGRRMYSNNLSRRFWFQMFSSRWGGCLVIGAGGGVETWILLVASVVTMVELQSCSLALHCVTTCILKLKIGRKFSCMTINFNLQAHGTRPTQESFFLLPTNFVFLSLSVQGAAPACRALRPLESPRSVPTFISRFASMAVPFKFRRKDE